MPLAVSSTGEVVGYAFPNGSSDTAAFSYLDGNYTPIKPPSHAAYFRTFLRPTFVKKSGLTGGNYQQAEDVIQGFLHSGSHSQSLVVPKASDTFVVGVTGAGDVVGYYYGQRTKGGSTRQGYHGFVRHKGAYSSFDFPSAKATYVIASNDQGSIAGYYEDAQGQHAFAGLCAADQAPCTQ